MRKKMKIKFCAFSFDVVHREFWFAHRIRRELSTEQFICPLSLLTPLTWFSRWLPMRITEDYSLRFQSCSIITCFVFVLSRVRGLVPASWPQKHGRDIELIYPTSRLLSNQTELANATKQSLPDVHGMNTMRPSCGAMEHSGPPEGWLSGY